MKKLYVAYGSNLNLHQMALRCPTAKVYAKGILNNWGLQYKGNKTNAHATISRKKGEHVPVIVWEILSNDEKSLDLYEGFPTYYTKQNVYVKLENGQVKKAMVYIMNTGYSIGTPSTSYIRTIRQGYIENNLDLDYFRKSLIHK